MDRKQFESEILGTFSYDEKSYSWRCHQALMEYDDFMNLLPEPSQGNIRNSLRHLTKMSFYAEKYNVEMKDMKNCWRGLDDHREWVHRQKIL